ncbi:bifunctional riboflavin kinase/FAD synthetase [Georgenia sp. TF02-10]|uniref:bifunctional riboflavin kinase/FAD synthetase n=1 Tax=Georgenia sp. TF02-10 TaxID=2917725 RepID=UPI001FA77C71|nr:bifunctional riboflavin kinase/FAD synthetase [Georgenia sp. TF02-10]UNX55921.1 bifunctional riboflavin kinase/FAD synthetase [Georgenia sp. TF02-10]
MQVWDGAAQVPADLGTTVATLGVFDGVHRGHQHVLGITVAEAEARDLTSVAITFHPHPAHVHRPAQELPLISSLPDRLERLAGTGLDAVLVVAYTHDFAQATAEEFVRRYLLEILHARIVVIGEDARFGRGNTGDAATMTELGRRLGFEVRVVPDRADPATGRRWSSTWVRQLLAGGDVAAAAHVLGRPHRVRGLVVHGAKRGRALGYPTANLHAADAGVVPADGVYAGWLLRPSHPPDAGAPARLPAAISVGTNPTFDGTERTVEAYVLGRTDLDLYDEEVVVELVERLRPMIGFADVTALLDQMADDVARAADLLGVPAPARPDVYAPESG